MTFFSDFAERLKRMDILQLAIVMFAILIASIVFTWPTDFYKANNSFFTVSTIRISILCLLALYYGSSSKFKSQKEKRLDIMAIAFLAVVSMPIEITSYSLSLPQIPIYWSLGLGLLDTLAYFCLGLILAQILHYLHLRFLTIVAVVASFLGLFMLDIKIGLALTNPIHAISKPSLAHIIAMLILAILSIWSLSKNDKSQSPTN